MKKIIALWAVPRSTSTAFEWMLRQRGDLTCFHEPYGEAWYQGERPLWPRATADSVRTPGLTMDSVTAKLKALATTGADTVFIKEFPHYIAHMWSDELLAMFTHTFLIRHPGKTIPSMYDKWPDFHESEVGFPEQRALFDRIAAGNDNHGPPPVIDSDDLLAAPAEVTAWWCAQVGIEFMPQALEWTPGARLEVSWWDGGVFHANLRASTGLQQQSRDYIDIDDAPARVRAIYARMLPHYEHMHRHRHRFGAADDS